MMTRFVLTQPVARNLLTAAMLLAIGMTTGHGPVQACSPILDHSPVQDSDSRPTVIRHADTAASSLADRVNWAKAEAGRRGFGTGYWVGYSIVRNMGERSFIGSF